LHFCDARKQLNEELQRQGGSYCIYRRVMAFTSPCKNHKKFVAFSKKQKVRQYLIVAHVNVISENAKADFSMLPSAMAANFNFTSKCSQSIGLYDIIQFRSSSHKKLNSIHPSQRAYLNMITINIIAIPQSMAKTYQNCS
jgi:hypothetical protein